MKIMGLLTTHILDTAHGCPAGHVHIGLYRASDEKIEYILNTVTNADGRCDNPVLKDSDFVVGTYELHFHIGDYFRTRGLDLVAPNFLEIIPVRFGVSSPEEHYHVPLLVSPFSYSTYRGS